MAITVTGAKPRAVTVASNTVTTNTIYNGSGTNDWSYLIPDAIAGTINTGVLVGGFGLQLETTEASGGIAMVNNGGVTVDQATHALILVGNGGAVTYSGTGFITSYGTGNALNIANYGAGSVGATIGNTITANDSEAVHIDTDSGAVSFTQAAGATISNKLGSISHAVEISTESGNIVANLNGTIMGDMRAVDLVSISGNITVNFTGSISSNTSEGLDSVTQGAITINSSGNVFARQEGLQSIGTGTGLVAVNVTAGQIHAGHDGIEATATGTGGVLINMTGGQIGTAAQRAGDNGIVAIVSGAAGDLTIMSTTIFGTFSAINARIEAAAATGDLAVTANGTTSAISGNGIHARNDGTGATTVTVNAIATVTGGIGVAAVGGAATVNNNGSIIGTGGVAVDFGDGNDNDTYNGVAGLLTGAVLGGPGNDTLRSGAGANTLRGGANNDTLNGGTGNDTMDGGAGNDSYFVDAAGDHVIEIAAGGTDNVRASVSYTLAAGVSVETLQTVGIVTTTAINLTGNALAQTLHGNAAANVLNGGGGADSLRGNAGNDTYFVDNAGDTLVEVAAANTDTVIATASFNLTAGADVEVLRTLGSVSTYNVNLVGNELVNTIQGNAGANVVNGRLGSDTLTGFTGSDIFRFDSALGVANIDTVTDYNVAADTVQLQNSIFTVLTTPGTLAAAAFRIGSAAADASDRIIYNSATGALIYDSNGNAGGGATQFATLAAGLALTNADFVVI